MMVLNFPAGARTGSSLERIDKEGARRERMLLLEPCSRKIKNDVEQNKSGRKLEVFCENHFQRTCIDNLRV